ncbi:GGDEF domain-containing protein [Thiovibrio frasassiensis]|jgi:diguanylate cyclase (GGDEF)-like protein|uniref:diguanylate cyclase n=1 Tax=Thiovibrio frasassiensis TaxID=2984131 RepID=A0A9X4MFR5_9BACT|nr:diguanylate cyclase [Thiovibrio frasassiensis]MDG4475548.1 diguanylate cyclase [Thiovibrio frasassiensis]
MRTLKAKIILPLIGLVVGVQLATGLFIAYRVKEAMHHENHRRALAVAYDLAHVSARSLISRDLAELRTYIRYTMTQEYVTQAMVVDEDCRIVMHSNLTKIGEQYAGTCPEQGQSLISAHYRNEKGENVVDALAPIEAAGVHLGTAILTYSHIGIENEIRLLSGKIALILGLGSAIAILFALLLAEYIVRPIRHLSRAAEALGTGHFNLKKMETDYSDEIGELAKSFYEMAGKLETEVCHDALTGLFTRNVFQIQLSEECARSQRHKSSLAVLMLDVDHFKKVNDTHGHGVGDEVLRHIAAILSRETRSSDCPARYGGEEFVVLLPDTRQSAALHVAEKIRSRIEADSFRLPDGRTIPLTVSIGVALFPEDTADHTWLVEFADQAMYEAKKLGRNNVFPATRLKRAQP